MAAIAVPQVLIDQINQTTADLQGALAADATANASAVASTTADAKATSDSAAALAAHQAANGEAQTTIAAFSAWLNAQGVAVTPAPVAPAAK